MPPKAPQLKSDPTAAMDDGKAIAALMKPFHKALMLEAFGDVANDGIAVAFDLANPYVRGTLASLAKQVTRVADSTKDEIRALVGRQAAEGWSVER
jgi:hypothetical protein